jgi:hypothetical protein
MLLTMERAKGGWVGGGVGGWVGEGWVDGWAEGWADGWVKLFFLVFMKSLLHRKQKRGQLFTTGGGGGEGFPPNLFSTNGKLLQYILK